MTSHLGSNNAVHLLARFIEQSTDFALILIGVDGRISGWFAGAEKIFGYTAAEVLGKPSAILFIPEDIVSGMPEHELAVADANGESLDDRWMAAKDGRHFWATGSLFAVRGPSGEILSYCKTLRNRTDQRGQIEALQHRVDEAEQANERKNVFISTLSHELRNPLSALVTGIELLQNSVPPSESLEFIVATFKRQVHAMRRMVEDILDVTRIGRGKIELKRSPTPLIDIVRSAVEGCAQALRDGSHEVQVIAPSAPVTVFADPARLQQVFVNLIQNSAKFSYQDGRIWVKLSIEDGEAVARVEDEGIGISADVLPRIFDLFAQGEPRSLSRQSGLGIGLAVVRDLVSMHGGSVQVKSDGPSKGSEFTVRLPLANEAGSTNTPSSDKRA
ncbi:MAG: ATP-binding protein [Bdellovibrionota bacterium]